MSEIITTYELRDPEIAIPMERSEFYREQIKTFKLTGKPSRAVEVVVVLLFNSKKQIILQKRAHNKAHNAQLIDKAIGGHIKFGDNPFYTVMVETLQELRVPSIVLRTDEDFSKTYVLLRSYLETNSILKQIDRGFVELNKVIDGEKITIENKISVFFGVFDGATKPVDQEASGVLYYNLDILKQEMKDRPENFTKDLEYLLQKYKKEIDDFLKHFD